MITIVGGKFRGKKIEVPPGNQVRPTLNKTREASFNVLQHLIRIQDMTALDLYAGSGAMGLEALSRGANQVIFVESSCKHFKVLQKNIKRFQLQEPQALAIRHSAREWLPSLRPHETPCLIFIDPPYQSGEYEKILPLITQLPTIPAQSILVIESPRAQHYPLENKFERIQLKEYGKTKLDFLVKC